MVSREGINHTKNMRLLNVGAGGNRPQTEIWWNLDNLRTQLKEGTPERTNLDKEPRYVECDLAVQSIPFPDEYFDGIALVHVIEHFTCHEAVDVLIKCRKVLKPGGLLIVSVPNAEYFLDVYEQDTKERAVQSSSAMPFSGMTINRFLLPTHWNVCCEDLDSI
jgi:SAM-dependent methyltransferase